MDAVFHTAAKPPPWGAYREYHRTNVTGTQNVIAACRKNSVHRLIHTSTPSVIFNGRDLQGVDESAPYPQRYTASYPLTKALAEQAVIRAADGELNTIVLRPHQIWGSGRSAFRPPDPRPSPQAQAHRRRPEPGGHDLHRQRRGSASAGSGCA